MGGKERIAALDWMLGTLRGMKVKCYVCSMNVDEVIMEGLGRVGLLKHFQRSEDNRIRIIPRGLPNKGLRVQQNLATHGVPASNSIFVDDDANNIAKVAEVNPGINQVHCS